MSKGKVHHDVVVGYFGVRISLPKRQIGKSKEYIPINCCDSIIWDEANGGEKAYGAAYSLEPNEPNPVEENHHEHKKEINCIGGQLRHIGALSAKL